jgi:signal transduction histidine kinase
MKLFRLYQYKNGKRHLGMFWRFFFAMSAASFIGTITFTIGVHLFYAEPTLQKVASKAFADDLNRELATLAPTLNATQNHAALCQSVLQSWLGSSNTLNILPENSSNSLKNLAQTKRLLLQYHHNNQIICSYPDTIDTTATTLPVRSNETSLFFSSAEVTPAADNQVTFHIAPLRGVALLKDSLQNIRWNILIFFIGFLNLCSAITLAPILVRRIKRADIVARGWTEGNMHARINDCRQDEFGHLVQSFNTLADSFVDVIKVKQELAAFEERHRLARDLHDTAKQRAFALNLQLTALSALGTSNPPESKRITSSALSLVQHLQHDLTNVIKRLSASTVTEMGIRTVLHQEVASLFDGTDIQWSISITDDTDNTLRDAPPIAQQVLLIAIEACANVLKHASASTMSVILTRTNQQYTLTIEDDGKGYDAITSDNMGMGLANMRLRARSLPHGEFTTSNKGGHGVIVSVKFKLEK